MKTNLRDRALVLLTMLLTAAGCATTLSQNEALPAETYPDRSAIDIARDAGRKPFEVLAFLGVEPGMTVLDVIASSGYYTEVLAKAVGPNGLVYAQNPAVSLRFYAGRNDRALNQRLFGQRLPNVRRLDREFDDLGLVAGTIDVAITALNFHDIYNRSPEAASQILLAIKETLKPGGVLGIIDHASNEGQDHMALHRMLKSDAVAAAEAVGFLVESSELLSNPNDDRTQSPFAEGLRGNTDRFVLKLTKPNS